MLSLTKDSPVVVFTIRTSDQLLQHQLTLIEASQ
jgi:hypothetical protein